MEGRAKLSLLRLHNAFIPIKQLHLFGRSKSVRFYLKRFRSYVTRSNLRDSISRDLAYISLHLLDANRETHEHWVFATLSRHKLVDLGSPSNSIHKVPKYSTRRAPRCIERFPKQRHPQDPQVPPTHPTPYCPACTVETRRGVCDPVACHP